MRLILSTTAIALALTAPGIALAQTAAPGAGDSSMLGEVIVTAQRQAQRLQDVPVAVTALDARALETRSVATLDNVANFTPNIRFDAAAQLSGASYNATVFIRGVGQNDFAIFSDPGVGIYVDDVYYARSIGGIMDAVDLESVQILRGPQGTLFGKNTIGGAVIITTRKPVFESEGSVEVTAGEFNRRDVRAMLNIPLVDDVLAARLTYAYFSRDGYVTRLWDGSDQGNRNSALMRAQLRWEPTERLRIDLAADYTRAREHQAANKLIAVAPAPGLTGQPFLAGWNAAIAPSQGIVAPNGQRTVNQSWITSDPFTTWSGGPNINDLDLWGLQANGSYQLADNLTFKSITAYRRMKAVFFRDGDNTPFTFRQTSNRDTVWQFSQEFQLAGESFGERLNWVAGAYYFKEDGADIATADIAPGLAAPPSPAQNIQNYVENKSWAAFAQGTFKLTDTLSLTAGGRYNVDDKWLRIYDVFLRTPGGAPFVNTTRTGSWESFTPRLGVEWKPTEDVLIYGSYSKGFKSGGFNARPTASEAEVTAFNPEEVETYELGAKTSWLDRRLILNAAVYWSKYQDIQLTVNQTPQNFVANAAEAEIFGYEIELTARPAPWLDINASIGHTDAEFTTIGTGNPLQVLPITLRSKLVKTPEWTGNVGAQITHALGEGEVVWRADASYSSKYYNDVPNAEIVAENGYTLVNARVTYTSPGETWKVSLFGTNLTDELYIISGNTSPAFGLAEATYGRPREWGVSLGYSF